MELFGALPLAKLCWDGRSFDDLDAWKPDSVTRCHLSVHLFYCAIESCVSVLLVHVVITGTTLITQPNSIVVDLGWILLKDLHLETWNQNLLLGNIVFTSLCTSISYKVDSISSNLE